MKAGRKYCPGHKIIPERTEAFERSLLLEKFLLAGYLELLT